MGEATADAHEAGGFVAMLQPGRRQGTRVARSALQGARIQMRRELHCQRPAKILPSYARVGDDAVQKRPAVPVVMSTFDRGSDESDAFHYECSLREQIGWLKVQWRRRPESH